MRICPKCAQSYDDDEMNFCLSDGSVLIPGAGAQETLVIKKRPSSGAPMRFPLGLNRIYSLFGYETDGGDESLLWHDPSAFDRLAKERGDAFLDRFEAWSRKKRKFLLEDLLNGSWIKIADGSPYQHIVNFNEDGTLIERPLFAVQQLGKTWGGSWKLIDGVLRLNIDVYELDVVGSIDGLHSGVEDSGGPYEQEEPNQYYFRVIHVPQV
jgi:hypothetical protein